MYLNSLMLIRVDDEDMFGVSVGSSNTRDLLVISLSSMLEKIAQSTGLKYMPSGEVPEILTNAQMVHGSVTYRSYESTFRTYRA